MNQRLFYSAFFAGMSFASGVILVGTNAIAGNILLMLFGAFFCVGGAIMLAAVLSDDVWERRR